MPEFVGDLTGPLLSYRRADGKVIRLPRQVFELAGVPVPAAGGAPAAPPAGFGQPVDPNAAPEPSPVDDAVRNYARDLAGDGPLEQPEGDEIEMPAEDVPGRGEPDEIEMPAEDRPVDRRAGMQQVNPYAPHLGGAPAQVGPIDPYEDTAAPQTLDPYAQAPQFNPRAPHLGSVVPKQTPAEQATGPIDPYGEGAPEEDDLESFDPEKQIIFEKSNVAIKQANNLINAYKKANESLGKVDSGKMEQIKADDAEFVRRLNEYDGAAKKAADFKFDRSRIWASKSTGDKIGVVIAAALAGIGSAMKKEGENPVIKMIDSLVQQDLNQQMAEQEALGKDVWRKRQAMDDFRGIANDRLAQFDLRKAVIYDQLARDVQSYGQNAELESIGINAAQMILDLNNARDAAVVSAARRDQEHMMKMAQADANIGLTIAKTQNYLADANLKMKKAGQAGAGGGSKASGMAYTEPTGMFDPRSKKELMGRRKLADKEKGLLREFLGGYYELAHGMNELYDKLRAMGRRTATGWVWNKLRGNSQAEAEFNSTRLKMLASFAQVLNGPSDAEPGPVMKDMAAEILPPIQEWYGRSDPAKVIANIEGIVDRAFTDRLEIMGVDSTIPQETWNGIRIREDKAKDTPVPTTKETISTGASPDSPEMKAATEEVEDQIEAERQAEEAAKKGQVKASDVYLPSKGDEDMWPKLGKGRTSMFGDKKRLEPLPVPSRKTAPASLITAIESLNAYKEQYAALADQYNSADLKSQEGIAITGELGKAADNLKRQEQRTAEQVYKLPEQTLRKFAAAAGISDVRITRELARSRSSAYNQKKDPDNPPLTFEEKMRILTLYAAGGGK